MSAVSAPGFLRRTPRRRPATRPARPGPPVGWTSGSTDPIDIVAPDRFSTAVLLDFAAPLFPAEIVPGPGYVVRLQPPAGPGWVLELVSLVDRWLDYVQLPGAKLRYGGRSYLIRASTDIAQFATATESSAAPSADGSTS